MSRLFFFGSIAFLFFALSATAAPTEEREGAPIKKKSFFFKTQKTSYSAHDHDEGDTNNVCKNFVEKCAASCPSGRVNEKKTLCKTWEGGLYKSCVCDYDAATGTSTPPTTTTEEEEEFQQGTADAAKEEILVASTKSSYKELKTKLEEEMMNADDANVRVVMAGGLPGLMMRAFFGNDERRRRNTFDDVDYGNSGFLGSVRQNFLAQQPTYYSQRVFRVPLISQETGSDFSDDGVATSTIRFSAAPELRTFARPFAFFSSVDDAPAAEDEQDGKMLFDDFQAALDGVFDVPKREFSASELGARPMPPAEFQPQKDENVAQRERALTCLLSLSLISLVLYSIFLAVTRIFSDHEELYREDVYYEFPDDSKMEPLLVLDAESVNENNDATVVAHSSYAVNSRWKSRK